MKTFPCFIVCSMLFAANCLADSYTITVNPGLTLIANHLDKGGNTLPEVLSVPDGSRLGKWSCALQQWVFYTYDSGFGGWVDDSFNPADNVTLAPGEGGMFDNLSGAALNLTFTGTPRIPVLPNLPCGCIPSGTISCVSRQAKGLGTFENITGLEPVDGTVLWRWDGVNWRMYSYVAGAWDPQLPIVNVGEAVTIATPCTTLADLLKWNQPPQPGIRTNLFYGWNELSVTNFPPLVADDWVCTNALPITKIRWWGSFQMWNSNSLPPIMPNAFQITIWRDAPAQPGGFSHPDYAIWQIECTNFIPKFVGWDYDPRMQIYEACFMFEQDLPMSEWFYQEPGWNVYWLSIGAEYWQGNPGPWPWGWKTRPRDFTSIAPDDAVKIWAPPAPGIQPGIAYESGEPIWWPTESNSWDMAFELISGSGVSESKWEQVPDLSESGMDVRATTNRNSGILGHLLADDFLCTSPTYLTNITVWGSYSNDFTPAVVTNVIFTLSIHEDIPAFSWPYYAPYSMPGSNLWTRAFVLGQYTCSVLASNLFEGWYAPFDVYLSFGDSICYQYDFNIPMQEAFLQEGTPEFPRVYWLDVQAQTPGNVPHFGWKTCITNWNDDAVWVRAGEPYNVPPQPPWNELRYPSGHQRSGDSIDLAFRLNGGSDGTVEIKKWSQPPVRYYPTNGYYGWNEMSVHGTTNVVADDWVCTNNAPVTDLRWWGSFLRWPGSMPPQLPDAFLIRFWTDLPAGLYEPFSQPGNPVWSIYCTNFAFEFEGWDFDPRDTNAPPEACFRFEQALQESEWWHQPPGTNVFWISIEAVYSPGQIPQYPWGWKTRPRVPWSPAPDDAVRLLDPFMIPPYCQPIWWPYYTNSWDLAFALGTMPTQETNCIQVVCSSNIVVTCAPTNGAIVYFSSYATNICTGQVLPVTCTPPSGSLFGIGQTQVCCTNISPGSTNWCCFTVTVLLDTNPPVIVCPTDIIGYTDPGLCEKSNVTWIVTATDDCDPAPVIVCNPTNGSTFAKGVTTVNCTATDSAGNSAKCSFKVTIIDAELPLVQCPSNIVGVVDCGSDSKTNVTFTATASDNCPGVTVACVPPSGSTFARGVTQVYCTATDTSGNTNNCSFTVTILNPMPSTNIVITNVVFTTKFNGWNEPSVIGSWMAADDWACVSADPVTDVRWWGSFLGWRSNTPPTLPDGFQIGFWTDVPAGVDAPFSHPGVMLKEVICTNYSLQFVGWDLDPRTMDYEACFRFEQSLAQSEWFYQSNSPPSTNIYWLSVAAIYSQEIPKCIFGWKTRPHDTNSVAPDDAVRFMPQALFEPLWWPTPTNSWDLAFELISRQTAVTWKFTTPPDLSTLGTDINDTSFGAGPPPYLLADDFPCTATGPITDIGVFGSWKYDNVPDPLSLSFTLSLHPDVGGMPGPTLWMQTFLPGQFQAQVVASQIVEGWVDPPGGYILPGDSICFYYTFHVASNAFVQTVSNIYWLDVQAQLPPLTAATFGWKTTVAPANWGSPAVWGMGLEPYPGPWLPLQRFWAPDQLPANLAFSVGTSQTNTVVKWAQPPLPLRTLTIKWNAEPCIHYQVQTTTNLTPVPIWTDLGPEVLWPVCEQSDIMLMEPKRFYRVIAPYVDP